MNRFEVLQRFAGDARIHRDHAFTFLVLVEMWLAQGQPDQFTPNFPTLHTLTKARRSSLYHWLAELEQFGYLSFVRGQNQYAARSVRFTIARIPTETGEGVLAS